MWNSLAAEPQNPDDLRLQALQHESQASASTDQVVSVDTLQDENPLDVAQKGYMKELQTAVEIQDQERELLNDANSVSVRSEHTFIQRRDLGMLDVAALIINKQIGNGIFTTPGLVLSQTGSKTISTVLWLFGGVWALIGYVCKGIRSSA